jgi:MoaA/NifB/PqqE/SkfB family radical SAM enzyme
VLFTSIASLPKPEPMPNLSVYENERTLRLSRYPECAENYNKFLESSRRNSVTEYLPTKLDIENLSRCNFRCVMCQVSEWPKGQRARDLDFHEFKHIIDENYGLVEIKLQGMGEPTLGRDDYFNMIKYARERNIWVRTVTNGSLLHLNSNIEKFISSDVNEIQISIDGATKKTFESIRKGSKFERVIENVTNLNQFSQSKGKNITKMWTVVQDLNIDELIGLVYLAKQMNFKSQVFSLDITDWGNENWTEKNKNISVSKKFDLTIANELYELGKELDIKVSFWNINEKYETTSLNKLCPWPFERSYISSDSRIVPCCMIADPDTFEIKSKGTFVEVWNSEAYQEFRKCHLDNNLPKVCKSCYK